MTRALFVVASDPFYSAYLDGYPERSVLLDGAEVISLLEKPWPELRPTVDKAIRQLADVAEVRVAGHLSTCFGKTHEKGWQQNFPELAAELMRAHTDCGLPRVEVWGFGHDPGCKIWAALSRIHEVLSDRATPEAQVTYIKELSRAFAPEKPGVSDAAQVELLRHNIPSRFMAVLQLLNNALEGRASDFGRASETLAAQMKAVDVMLIELQAMADRVADEGRRADALGALRTTKDVIATVPAISGTPRDAMAFRLWIEQVRTATRGLKNDFFL